MFFLYLERRYVCALETIPEEAEGEKEEWNSNETKLTSLSHHSAVGHSPEEPNETEAESTGVQFWKYLQVRGGSKGKSEFFMTNVIISWHYYWRESKEKATPSLYLSKYFHRDGDAKFSLSKKEKKWLHLKT